MSCLCHQPFSDKFETYPSLRKQKLAYANEGAEKARAEAEVAARKRKVEEQAKWEGEFLIPLIPDGAMVSIPRELVWREFLRVLARRLQHDMNTPRLFLFSHYSYQICC